MVKRDVGGDPVESAVTVKPSLCGFMPLVGESHLLLIFTAAFHWASQGSKAPVYHLMDTLSNMSHCMMFTRGYQEWFEWGLNFSTDVFHTSVYSLHWWTDTTSPFCIWADFLREGGSTSSRVNHSLWDGCWCSHVQSLFCPFPSLLPLYGLELSLAPPVCILHPIAVWDMRQS